jgi:hypothetical protein
LVSNMKGEYRQTVFQNRMLRKIFRSQLGKVIGRLEKVV